MHQPPGTGRLYELGIPPLSFERFATAFQTWDAHYNTARPHTGLAGQTPLERWLADPTPVREIPTVTLRFLLLAGAERRITKHGIRFGGFHFIAPDLNGRVGQTVEVRWMPHDLRTIDVFYAGQWLCTARPQGVLTAEERGPGAHAPPTRRGGTGAPSASNESTGQSTTCPDH